MATVSRRGKRWFAQVRKVGRPSQSKSFDSRAEAIGWAAKMQNQLERSIPSQLGSDLQTATLAELIHRYANTISRHKRGVSPETYRLNKISRHTIGQLPIKKLTPADLAAYRDDRLAEVKPSTVHKEMTLLQAVIQTAQSEWGVFLPENPISRVRRPQFKDARQRRISPQETAQLRESLANCRSPLPLLIFDMALATAMRRGEILTMKWRDVNLPQRTLRLPTTKNGEVRDIPLTKDAMRVLELAAELSRHSAHVFPIEVDAFKSAWQRALARTDIIDLRFHDLRHEAISRFFELGLSLPEVAVISGHKDPRMLLRYTHIPATAIVSKLDGLCAY